MASLRCSGWRGGEGGRTARLYHQEYERRKAHDSEGIQGEVIARENS